MQTAVRQLKRELESLGFRVEPHKKTFKVVTPGGVYFESFPKTLSPSLGKQIAQRARKAIAGHTPVPVVARVQATTTAPAPVKPAVVEPPPPRTVPAEGPKVAANMARDDAQTVLYTVTPTLAEEWLRTMEGNRPLRNRDIEKYARDMAAGKWVVDGAALKFDREGHLIDGQHRLWACIEAGKPFESMVAMGLSPDVFSVIDSGVRRSAADMLGLEGQSHAALRASVVKMVVQWEKKGMTEACSNNYQPTNTEVREMNDRIGGQLDDSLTFGRKCAHLLTPTVAAFLHYVFSTTKDRADANGFFGWLSTGEGLTKSSPIYVLRERLIRIKRMRTYAHRRELVVLVIRAWNACREGRTMTKITRGAPLEDAAVLPEIV